MLAADFTMHGGLCFMICGKPGPSVAGVEAFRLPAWLLAVTIAFEEIPWSSCSFAGNSSCTLENPGAIDTAGASMSALGNN